MPSLRVRHRLLRRRLWWLFADPRCLLFGCADRLELNGHCGRCGAHPLDDGGAFCERATLPRLWWRSRELVVGKRCQQCGRRLPRRPYAHDFCSDACFSAWLPF